MDDWTSRVATYIDELQTLVDDIDLIFQQTHVSSTHPNPDSIQGATSQLQQGLEALEQKVAQREDLLKSEDAPGVGFTLIEKLRRHGQDDLADRADQVAEQIAITHQRSMSLFVCQFHLANLTTDLVRILTGGDYPATYGGTGTVQTTPQGGLFNQSA